jgi:hypothetical protein
MPDNERIYTIKHRMHEILVVDFTGCTPPQVQDLTLAVRIFVTNQKKHSVLILVDFGGIRVDKELLQSFKEATALDKPFVRRVAWINAENFHPTLKKSLQDFSTRNFPVFPSRAAALEYLTAEEHQEHRAAGKK